DGAAAVLLQHLPFAPDETTEEETWFGLDALAAADRRTHEALAAALADRAPARRAAAACVLGRVGTAGQHDTVARLLDDPEAVVRLRAAQGLLAGEDARGLPALIALLKEPDLGVAWQAEELLHWAAGDGAPGAAVGTEPP